MELSIEIAPGRIAHGSGALFLLESRTLMIADAHLGYGFAQRRRGQLGPTTDGGILDRLQAVLDFFEPSETVFLGDTVHAPSPMAAEREFIESVLRSILEKSKVRVVQGNHDRAVVRDFGHLPIEVAPSWREGNLLGLHGDRLRLELPDAGHYLLGHLHPAINLRDDAGVNRRVPAFLVSKTATVLPAFSPFAAGMDVSKTSLPKEVKAILGRHEIYVATGRQVALLPAKANRSGR
jgi:hypothetical protein